jgi:hypothetical protein
MAQISQREGQQIVHKLHVELCDMAASTDRGGSDYAYNQRKRQEHYTYLARTAQRLLDEHGYESFYQDDIETLQGWISRG